MPSTVQCHQDMMSHCFSKLPSYVSCNFAHPNIYRCISVAWAISLVGWSLASVAVLTQRTKSMGEWCKADIMTNHVKKLINGIHRLRGWMMDDNINNNNICSRKSNPCSSWEMVGWHQRTGKGLGNMSNEGLSEDVTFHIPHGVVLHYLSGCSVQASMSGPP